MPFVPIIAGVIGLALFFVYVGPIIGAILKALIFVGIPLFVAGAVGYFVYWKIKTRKALDSLSPAPQQMPRRHYVRQRIAILKKIEARTVLPPDQAEELRQLQNELGQ